MLSVQHIIRHTVDENEGIDEDGVWQEGQRVGGKVRAYLLSA